MTEPKDPFPVAESCSNFEAKIIVSVLQGAGIPALTSTGSLLDEFAMSQAMMSNVDVFVARDDAERAQAVLAEAREAGRLAEDTEDS